MIVQFLNQTGGSVITSLAVGSASTITTEGINTSRVKSSGIFIIHTGTISLITRQVSYDNTNFYTPWDSTSSLGAVLSTSSNNSRYIVVEPLNANSGNVVSPYTRYNITTLSGGTLSMVYVANETPQS